MTLIVQPIPASDKGSHGASGDGVKTVIHDNAVGELVPEAAEVISRAFGWIVIS